MTTTNPSNYNSIPLITGSGTDVASNFLGTAPELVSPAANSGATIYASGDSRMVVGDVMTTITGPVERIELHVTNPVSQSLGLSNMVAPNRDISVHEQLTGILRNGYEDVFMSSSPEPYENTCSWILAHPEYIKWKDDLNPDFLWLCGTPGCGKTIVSSFLLRYWKANAADSHLTAYFFFSQQVEKAKTPQNFLSALIYQILQLYPAINNKTKDTPGLQNMQSVVSLTNSYEGLWTILVQVLTILRSSPSTKPEKPLLCIVDALEECTDTMNMQFLRRLQKELRGSSFIVKVLVTCRRDFMERFPPHLTHSNTIDVDEENRHDIRSYVTDHLRLFRQNSCESDVLSKLEVVIPALADGVFLWAVLIIEGLLQRGGRLQTVLKAITTFPKDRDGKLKKLYEEILKQATSNLEDEEVLTDIKSVLSVVITAANPLTLCELEDCLEAEEGDGRHLNLERDIKTTFRGLLKIEGSYVRPFHITLRSYLEDATECLPRFSIGKGERHARLAKACLRYAADRIGLASSHGPEEIETVLQENAFLRYATNEWLYHANGAETFHQDLVELVHDLLGDMASFLKWYAMILSCKSKVRQEILMFQRASWGTTDIASLQPRQAHILSLICASKPLFNALFCSVTLDSFSEAALGPENVDAFGRTPAHWASSLGVDFMNSAFSQSEWLAFMLGQPIKSFTGFGEAVALSRILDVFPKSSQSVDQLGKTPLHIACNGGDVQKVQVLLESGADIQARDNLGYSPLHFCCAPLGLDTAKLVVSHKAEVNLSANDGTTPLHHAAVHGQEQIVKLLIENGARVAVEDNQGRTPLHCAVMYGDDYAGMMISDMAQHDLLVSSDENSQTHLASFMNSQVAREKTIKRLIAAGAGLEHRSKTGNTPLLDASAAGHLQSVKILTSAKADLNAKNSQGWFPLFAAAYMGRESVGEYLMDAKADLSVTDVQGNTALHASAHMGNQRLTERLIKAQVNVNAENEDQWTPLHSCCAMNLEPLVSFAASRRGIKPETLQFVQGKRVRKHEVWLTAHENILRALILAGANIHATDLEGSTPLHIAALHGYEPMVRILLESGAQADAVNQYRATPLFNAAVVGNDSCVKTLVKKTPRHIPNAHGLTPLHGAAQFGHESTVKILLEAGVEVNCVNEEGDNPIYWIVGFDSSNYVTPDPRQDTISNEWNVNENELRTAAAQKGRSWGAIESGQIECLKLLLSSGADVNICRKNRCSPILIAAELSRLSMAKILLQHNADPELKDDKGNNALMYAVGSGSTEMVKLLLEHGADWNIQSKDGWTPVSLALEKNHLQVAALLLAKMFAEEDVNASFTDNSGGVALLGAAVAGEVDVVKTLLEKGEKSSVRNENGVTPLGAAAASGHVEVVKLLLTQDDTNVDAMDTKGSTPLMEASEKGHVEIVVELLEHAANPSIKNNEGLTALIHAVRADHSAVVEILLECGADPNAATVSGHFPLHDAVVNGNTYIITLLIASGANLHIHDADGFMPLHYAALGGELSVIQRLLAKENRLDVKDGSGRTALQLAAYNGSLDVVSWLIEHGPAIDVAADDGSTALANAVRGQHQDIVARLLDAGADPNIKITHGYTAQHLAVRGDNIEILKLLESNGGLLDTVDDDGGTLLHWAARYDCTSVLEFLLTERNHNPTVCDALQISPLHQAVFSRNLAAAEILLKAHADHEQLDGYGRTCIEWATEFAPMFELLSQGTLECKRTPEDVSRKQLLSSLTSLFQRADANVNIPFDRLGRCFLLLNDEEAACTAFEQEIRNFNDSSNVVHNASCSMCSEPYITGLCYVCVECVDRDLCESCKDEYETESNLPGCSKHRFIVIPSPSWKTSGSANGSNSDRKAWQKKWLGQMKQKYLGIAEET